VLAKKQFITIKFRLAEIVDWCGVGSGGQDYRNQNKGKNSRLPIKRYRFFNARARVFSPYPLA
jgi:hypothetical protein